MRQAILSIIIIVAVVGAGFFLYRFLTSGPSGGETAVAGGAEESKLADYRKIETLQLDLGVLSDPFFKSLFSPSQALGFIGTTTVGVRPGRPNPFLPF